MRWTRLGRIGACLALACGAAHAQQPYPQGSWPGTTPAVPYSVVSPAGNPAPPQGPPSTPYLQPGGQFQPFSAGPSTPPPQFIQPQQPPPPPGPRVDVPRLPASLQQVNYSEEPGVPQPPPPDIPVPPTGPFGPSCPAPPPVVCPVEGQEVRLPCVVPQMIGASLDYFYRPLLQLPNPRTPLTVWRIVSPQTPVGQRNLPNVILTGFYGRGGLPLQPSAGLMPSTVIQQVPGQQAISGSLETVIRARIATRGAWRIGDNESPQPQDRVYVGYNFFQDVGEAYNDGLLAAFRLPNGTLSQVNGSTLLVPVQGPRIRVHQVTIGAEKTIPNNDNVSVGARIPIYVIRNGAGIEDTAINDADLGDISLNLKVCIINDDAYSGFTLSTGALVTIPSGADNVRNLGTTGIHTTVVQPYLGFLQDYGDIYIHGFSSVAVPTEGPEPIQLFNDLGVGWYAYRSSYWYLSGIVPTVEGHVTTPLSHREAPESAVRVFDQVYGTAGVHFVFGPTNCTLTVAGSTPFMGPKPFDFELIGQLNFRF